MPELALTLYLVGGTPPSERAMQGLDELRRALGDAADIEVIDLRENPDLAESEGILATPLLVRTLPLPKRRVIGDLSDPVRVLASLGLRDQR